MALKKLGAPAPSPTPSDSSGTATPAANTAPPTPAPAPVAPPTPAPAAPSASAPAVPPAQARDLAAMRARLAGGQNGGVNSPEGAEKLTPALVAPRTQPTADGGAEPLPTVQPAAPAAESSTATPAELQTQGQLTRGQKAAATRAANKAKAASDPSTTLATAAPILPADSTPAPAAVGSVSTAGEAVYLPPGAVYIPPPKTELQRIVDALERIAYALELAPPEGK